MKFCDYLRSIDACPEAVEWVGDRTLRQAWKECPRGDWMLWLMEQHYGRRGWPRYRKIVLCACDIAERALRFVPAAEDRPRQAIEAARRCAKDPTNENKRAAREAAEEAAGAAGAAGAFGAAFAARAAWAAGWTTVGPPPWAAEEAAREARARAAAWAAWAAARATAAELSAQADICRKWLKPGPLPKRRGGK